jgi:hypothetical protein
LNSHHLNVATSPCPVWLRSSVLDRASLRHHRLIIGELGGGATRHDIHLIFGGGETTNQSTQLVHIRRL